jgi:hypothetical protein
MFHDWKQSFGGFVDEPFLGGGGRYQLVGEKLDLSRTPTPFDPALDNFVSGSGASTATLAVRRRRLTQRLTISSLARALQQYSVTN